ncbi:MAG: hypothetical protein ACTHLZ_03305, partial [Tepidisphaeraceae bacterium]
GGMLAGVSPDAIRRIGPVLATLLLAAGASADTVTLAHPIAAEVYVKGDAHATELRGALLHYDDDGFTLRVNDGEKTLAWTDVTPASAYAMRQKAIDRKKPGDWLTLGKFGWALGAKAQAETALKMAARLDPSLQGDVQSVMASPAGTLVAKPAPKELLNSGSPIAEKPPTEAAETPTKFAESTPEQIADAMRRVHEQKDEVEQTLHLKLAEFSTDHFIIFTDWDPGDYNFLKINLEQAYAVVARQFDANPKDNVFVGKLPVYMLGTYDEFAKFAREIDKFTAVNNRTAGYYLGNTEGFGHMAMWKPNQSLTGTNNMDDARRLWAYVLVHEFTHAFLARYKSNVFVPRWLNEGIAEVIAMHQFPYPDHYRMARYMASVNHDFSFLFDSSNRPSGEYYPVMQSMVELLVQSDRQGFLKLIDAIKKGEPCEQAMQEIYHTNYDRFQRTWRDWAKKQYAGY